MSFDLQSLFSRYLSFDDIPDDTTLASFAAFALQSFRDGAATDSSWHIGLTDAVCARGFTYDELDYVISQQITSTD